MDIYIVIERKRESLHDEFFHTSFETEKGALDCAVNRASGTSRFGEDTSLEKIIKVNTDTRKVSEFDLTIEKGRFKLIELI